MSSFVNRYSRQAILSQVGSDGQSKIRSARVAIVGVGALGSVLAQLCARAGVGFLRLIDRDIVELTNLQRQVLFTEIHAKQGAAKATASKEQLQKINSEIAVEAIVDDLRLENIESILGDVDVILDGTDNFETRYLVNDFALKNKIPYIYGGAIETRGMVYAVLPDKRPCLRCLFPQSAVLNETQSCDRNGILASVSHWTASLQFTQLIKLLVEGGVSILPVLTQYDIWKNEIKKISAEFLGEVRCEGCEKGYFAALEPQRGTQTLKLCGRNAVQIHPESQQEISFESLSRSLAGEAQMNIGADFARIVFESYELTVFKNGRALVKGTEDPVKARSLYARWVGC